MLHMQVKSPLAVLVDELPRVDGKVHVRVNDDGEVRNVMVLAERKGFISIVN